MPAAFIGHGNPMNAVEVNRYTEIWRELGKRLPRPRGIVVVSAHWYVEATAVTAMPQPRTIHDFLGFPQELFDVQYPAPGDPSLAADLATLAQPTEVILVEDSWGIDHGAWSVLVHLYPEADVPVVQLSIDARQPFEHHVELGARLGALREEGVLFLASGNVVHNLRRMDFASPEAGFEWCRRFDDAARAVMTSVPSNVLTLRGHPDFRLSVPTPDHFIPLLYLAGMAGDGPAQVLVDNGPAYGSISMASYTLDEDGLLG
ncbi:MAG: 4,5-DOPA dioxygenase extradiol [Acidimicrobiales bacterium]